MPPKLGRAHVIQLRQRLQLLHCCCGHLSINAHQTQGQVSVLSPQGKIGNVDLEEGWEGEREEVMSLEYTFRFPTSAYKRHPFLPPSLPPSLSTTRLVLLQHVQHAGDRPGLVLWRRKGREGGRESQ